MQQQSRILLHPGSKSFAQSKVHNNKHGNSSAGASLGQIKWAFDERQNMRYDIECKKVGADNYYKVVSWADMALDKLNLCSTSSFGHSLEIFMCI